MGVEIIHKKERHITLMIYYYSLPSMRRSYIMCRACTAVLGLLLLRPGKNNIFLSYLSFALAGWAAIFVYVCTFAEVLM